MPQAARPTPAWPSPRPPEPGKQPGTLTHHGWENFVATYGTDNTFNGHGEAVRAVLSFVSRYLVSEDRDYLDTHPYSIHYTDYDWLLNEQRDGVGHDTS